MTNDRNDTTGFNLSSRARLGLAGVIAAAAIAALAIGSQNGSADEHKGDIERGRALAETNCAACHGVGPGTESPVPEAPAFETLGRLWPVEYLEEALAEGIMVGHETHQMPIFQFEPGDIQDLIAYLKSIQVPASIPADAPTDQ